MNRFLLIFILLLTGGFSFSQYNNVQDVPDPKSNGQKGYVSNPNNIMSAADVQEANELLADLEAVDSFQVALVVLESIGSNVPKDFATELFAHWKVGHLGRDDGLLILFVNDQRRIEFETGYGTETVLSDAQCYSIQQTYMVPEFKDGNYSFGLLQGIKEVKNELTGKKVDHFDIQEHRLNEKYLLKQAEEQKKQRIIKIIIWVAAWHGIGTIIFLIALFIARFRQDPYDKYKVIRYFHVWIWAILFPVTHIFIVILAKRLKNRYRNMIRFSGRTGEIMRKLSEEDEDKYLSKGQVSEELVKSIDYDVWVTDADDDVLVLAYRPLFSKYSKCPKCSYKTYIKVYDRQVVAPTYYSSGKGERKHQCSNCNHVKRITYHIPRLRRSSNTSRSGGGWIGSGGGGGSSFGGSGSWGGGSSGGGGAGSSW